MKQNLSETKTLINKIYTIPPTAKAAIYGRGNYLDIFGEVEFFQFENHVIVAATIHNLPTTKTNIFGFHIHENGDCSGDFSSAGGHFSGTEHPNHKGDMPVLFGNNGNAFLVFCTNRFTVDEVIGKSVIIHDSPDDFTTQPAGNSGERIACGIIEKD